MAFVSRFIDRPVVLGAGAVGSAQLGARAVTRPKIALSAVGSQEQGTYSLNKAVGTLSNLDIGTFIASFGSAGTFSAPAMRARYGSYGGTLAAPRTRGAVGSFGSLNVELHRGRQGSFRGTITGPLHRGRFGSFNPGTIKTNLLRTDRGSLGTTTSELFRGRVGSYRGSMVTTFVRATRGSFGGTLSAPVHRGAYGSFQNMSRGIGTIGGKYGSYGTVVGVNQRGRKGSWGSIRSNYTQAGTLKHGLVTGSTGSATYHRFGSVQAKHGSFYGTARLRMTRGDRGSFGTLAYAHGRYRYGSGYGTQVSPLSRGARGSYGTLAAPFTRTRYGSGYGTQVSPFSRGARGSLGTLAAPFTRTRYGSGYGTNTSPLTRGARGSHGTLAAPFTRTRYGSSYGTNVSPLTRGGKGSFGTLSAPFARLRYGSASGTIAGPFHRGNKGSFGSVIGRVGSFAGTIRGRLQGGFLTKATVYTTVGGVAFGVLRRPNGSRDTFVSLSIAIACSKTQDGQSDIKCDPTGTPTTVVARVRTGLNPDADVANARTVTGGHQVGFFCPAGWRYVIGSTPNDGAPTFGITFVKELPL